MQKLILINRKYFTTIREKYESVSIYVVECLLLHSTVKPGTAVLGENAYGGQRVRRDVINFPSCTMLLKYLQCRYHLWKPYSYSALYV